MVTNSRYYRHFVGITRHWVCFGLNGEDLSCYTNKTESVSLRKCPYDHWVNNEAYLSAITVTNISQSFTYRMAAKINWHTYGTKLHHCYPMYNAVSPLFGAMTVMFLLYSKCGRTQVRNIFVKTVKSLCSECLLCSSICFMGNDWNECQNSTFYQW